MVPVVLLGPVDSSWCVLPNLRDISRYYQHVGCFHDFRQTFCIYALYFSLRDGAASFWTYDVITFAYTSNFSAALAILSLGMFMLPQSLRRLSILETVSKRHTKNHS